MLGTPFVVIWLVGFIADLDIDSWLIKGIMYAGVWVAVQFLSKYVSITAVQRLHTHSLLKRQAQRVDPIYYLHASVNHIADV